MMRMVVVGCGRVGAEVAVSLARRGHVIVVIDANPQAFERLGKQFTGVTITGTGYDREVLERAGIERADALAALTADDNVNIITARLAQNIFRVPKVVARMYDPQRAEIYQRLGLLTVSSTAWSVRRVTQLLEHHELDVLLMIEGGQVGLIEVEAPPVWAGCTVNTVSAPGELLVVTITRQGQTIIPSLGAPFQAGDRVVIAALPEAQRRLQNLLGEA